MPAVLASQAAEKPRLRRSAARLFSISGDTVVFRVWSRGRSSRHPPGPQKRRPVKPFPGHYASTVPLPLAKNRLFQAVIFTVH